MQIDDWGNILNKFVEKGYGRVNFLNFEKTLIPFFPLI